MCLSSVNQVNECLSLNVSNMKLLIHTKFRVNSNLSSIRKKKKEDNSKEL